MAHVCTNIRAVRSTSITLGCSYLVALILLVTWGCAEPLRVAALAHIDANGDINGNINGNIKTELAPTPKLQPVTAMTLPHRPANGEPVVAVVDVDGLLLEY